MGEACIQDGSDTDNRLMEAVHQRGQRHGACEGDVGDSDDGKYMDMSESGALNERARSAGRQERGQENRAFVDNDLSEKGAVNNYKGAEIWS